jgi:hypothetical protein
MQFALLIYESPEAFASRKKGLQLQPNNAVAAMVLYSSNGIVKGDASMIAEVLDATAAGIKEKMKSSPVH